MSKPAHWAMLITLLAASRAPALDPQLRISQYHKQYWQVEQGLPHSYVTAISQSPDGYLLVGTDEGLARFDGLRFRPLRADPALRLSTRWVSALLLSRDQSLWIGTFDGLLLELRDGSVVNKYQTGGSVFDLLQDAGGVIWVSTRNAALRLQNGKLTPVAGLLPPLDTSWNVLAAERSGSVWVVTASGLFRISGGAVTQRLRNSPDLGDILTVTTLSNGGALVGTTHGLYRIPAGNHDQPIRIPGVTGPVVTAIEDRDGTVWAGTWGQGLLRVNARGVDRWTMREGLPENFIRTLMQDAEGNLWIGMRSGGLGRWKDSRLVPFGPPEGLAGSFATTVAADPVGDLWLGTWRGGLYRLRNGAVESQPTPMPTLYFTVRALAFDHLGHPWIGNWEGLFEFDGVGYRRFATETDSPYRRVSALLFDHTGALWIGTVDRGLFRFPDGRPSSSPPAPLLAESEISCLLEDSSGRIWVGTRRGVLQFANAASSEARRVQAVPTDQVESIFEDSRKRIWISTSEGRAAVISATATVVLDQKNGLPGHPLYRILEAMDGSFWISSPNGILEIPAGAAEMVLAGKARSLAVILHGQSEGMRTVECHGLSQPAGWKDRDGNLWFPTAKGFVEVRAASTRTLAPPVTVIEDVATGAGPAMLAPTIDLQPGARNVEIAYTGLRFSNPGALQFRYRLSNNDPDWVEAGSERAAHYNQLPPGEHLFEVQARDPSGEWSTSATLTLSQHPRFYQSWWFAMAVGLALLGLFWAIYQWRLYVLHSRYAMVLEERNRIGREWHDTLVAGFSAISLQLEAALARLSEQPERTAEILGVTRKMVHHYRAEARRVIWDLRDSRPEGETLIEALESALGLVKEHRGILGKVTVTGQPVDVPLDMRHNLLRICQEAMSNAVRHGHPSRVDVDLTFSPAGIRASVRDDGCGFPASDPGLESAGHFGLAVMQERARRMGGRLAIHSQPGGGTSVETEVPMGRSETN